MPQDNSQKEDFIGRHINSVIQGNVLDVLRQFPSEVIDCIVTSPPYWGLRDYGVEGQIGLEKTLQEYLDKMLAVTAELKRVLKKTGTMFWNHGDSYGGIKVGNTETRKNPKVVTNSFTKNASGYEKSLLFQNFRLALRMMDEQGWIMRNTIIWHKPNCMPSSVKDRFTVDFEPVFFFTKSKKYWFETQYEPHTNFDKPVLKYTEQTKNALHENPTYRGFAKHDTFPNPLGRNKRAVWNIPTSPYPDAHFATFPEELIVTPIKAGCPEMICKKCGKAREAIFESEYQKKEVVWHNEKYGEEDETGARRGRTQPDAGVMNTSKKIGYSDCKCNAGWRRGVVLDPFCGTNTTGFVARAVGRDWLGIEISSSYIRLAEQRLAQKTLF